MKAGESQLKDMKMGRGEKKFMEALLGTAERP